MSKLAGRAMAALIERLLPLDEDGKAGFAGFRESVLKNWNGIEVGRIRAAAGLA